MLNMNVEVNLKVVHLNYISTIEQKNILKDLSNIKPRTCLFMDPWIHDKNGPDPDSWFYEIMSNCRVNKFSNSFD